MHLATAALLHAGVTAVLCRNLLPDLTTHLYSDLGDPLLNTAIIVGAILSTCRCDPVNVPVRSCDCRRCDHAISPVRAPPVRRGRL
jgi:hypothetical protein